MYRLASPEKSHAGWAILEEFTASSLKTAEKGDWEFQFTGKSLVQTFLHGSRSSHQVVLLGFVELSGRITTQSF